VLYASNFSVTPALLPRSSWRTAPGCVATPVNVLLSTIRTLALDYNCNAGLSVSNSFNAP